MAEIKKGDVVRLKSGGPNMTVSSIGQKSGNVTCQWFMDDKLESGVFSPESLVKFSGGEQRQGK